MRVELTEVQVRALLHAAQVKLEENFASSGDVCGWSREEAGEERALINAEKKLRQMLGKVKV